MEKSDYLIHYVSDLSSKYFSFINTTNLGSDSDNYLQKTVDHSGVNKWYSFGDCSHLKYQKLDFDIVHILFFVLYLDSIR